MTFTFKQRKTNLKKLCKKTNLKPITDLISVGKIKKNNLSYIQNASKILLQSCIIGSSKKIKFKVNFDDVIKQIKKKRPENITHNGLVVVRKESSIEYALFLKSLFCFLDEIGLLKKIDYFISPPQLRIKIGQKSNNDNASDLIHSDAWTPYNTDKSYTLYLPVFGDCKKNYVSFFKPKKSFNPQWLKPKKFVDGKDIGKEYSKLKMNYTLGKVYVTDCATLHQSVLLKNAGPRVSIDMGFIAKKVFRSTQNHSHVKAKDLSGIGYNKFMTFKDSHDDKLEKILLRKKQSLANRKIISF